MAITKGSIETLEHSTLNWGCGEIGTVEECTFTEVLDNGLIKTVRLSIQVSAFIEGDYRIDFDGRAEALEDDLDVTHGTYTTAKVTLAHGEGKWAGKVIRDALVFPKSRFASVITESQAQANVTKEMAAYTVEEVATIFANEPREWVEEVRY